jgi:hypothetical protein
MGRLSEAINGTRRGIRPTYLNGGTNRDGAGIRVQAEIDEASFEEVNEALARLMINHPDTRKRIKKMLTEEARMIRQNISKDMRLNMDSDPRRAYAAVKRSLYKKILGFNVSILDARKGSVRSMTIWRPPRKLDENPHQRGGNRSDRTKALDGYFGKDRAFVLRFYNSGTTQRATRYGNRGAIRSRRIFETSASFQMQGAINEISEMIENVMKEEFNK